MAVLTPAAFQSKYAAKFADNEFQNINEKTFRDFATDIADSFSLADAKIWTSVLTGLGRPMNELVLPQPVQSGKWYLQPDGIWEAKGTFNAAAAPMPGAYWRRVVEFSTYTNDMAVAAVETSGQFVRFSTYEYEKTLPRIYVLDGTSGTLRGGYQDFATANAVFQPGDTMLLSGTFTSLRLTKSGLYTAAAAHIEGLEVGEGYPLDITWRGGTFGGRVVVIRPNGAVGNTMVWEDFHGTTLSAYFEVYGYGTYGTGVDAITYRRCSVKSGFSAANGAGAVLLRQRNDADAQAALLTVEDCRFASVYNSVFTGTAHNLSRIELRGLQNVFTPAAGKPLHAITRVGSSTILQPAEILLDNRGARLLSPTGAVGLLTFDGTSLLLNGAALGAGSSGGTGTPPPTGPPAGFAGAVATGDGTWLDVYLTEPGVTLTGPWQNDGAAKYLAAGSTGIAALQFYGKQVEIYGTKFGSGGPAEAYLNNARRATVNTNAADAVVDTLLYTFPAATADGVQTAELRRTGESGVFIISRFRIK